MIKQIAGMVHPSEYDWKQQFNTLDTINPFTLMDTGKVLGLASAYEDALQEIAELKGCDAEDN